MHKEYVKWNHKNDDWKCCQAHIHFALKENGPYNACRIKIWGNHCVDNYTWKMQFFRCSYDVIINKETKLFVKTF